MRVYPYGGLCRLLAEKGYANCKGFGTLAGDQFKLGSKRLYLVATKRA